MSSRKTCGSSRPGCRTPCRAVGPDGAEFVLAFDDGNQSESNTLLLTDWFAHTPPEVLAKNFRVAQEVFDDIPLHNLWIFPGDEPGDLEADQVAAGVEWGGTRAGHLPHVGADAGA